MKGVTITQKYFAQYLGTLRSTSLLCSVLQYFALATKVTHILTFRDPRLERCQVSSSSNFVTACQAKQSSIQGGERAPVQWLCEATHVREVVSSNLSTVYCMDHFSNLFGVKLYSCLKRPKWLWLLAHLKNHNHPFEVDFVIVSVYNLHEQMY